MVAAGAALVVAGKAVSLFSMLLGGVATILPLLLSPIGMVITAVGALGAYMLTSTKAGGKALDWLGGKFAVLQDDASTAYQGITDALAAGDIGLAAKVLWSTLKLWWTRGVAWISRIWYDGLLWFKKIFVEAWGGLRQSSRPSAYGLQIAWIEATSYLGKAWQDFVFLRQAAGDRHGQADLKTWNKIKGVFDDSFDADAANKAVDMADQYLRDKWARQENVAKRQAIEAERKARRAAEDKDLHRTPAGGSPSRRPTSCGRSTRSGTRRSPPPRPAWRRRRKSFDWPRKKAHAERKQKEADAGPGTLKGPEDLLKRIKDASAGLSADQHRRKTSVTGTFNAIGPVRPGCSHRGRADRQRHRADREEHQEAAGQLGHRRLGVRVGVLQEDAMAITVSEKYISRAATDSGRSSGGGTVLDELTSTELHYVVRGTTDERLAIQAVRGTAPDDLQRHGPGRDQPGARSPTRSGRRPSSTPPPRRSWRKASRATASTPAAARQHITQALSHVNTYVASGETAPDFKGAIGVTKDSVDGVDITVPVYSFSETHILANADVTNTYKGKLFALTGKTNKRRFKGFAPASACSSGASGSKRGKGDWEITFHFAASPNKTGLTVGEITGIAKKGWEYLWVRYEDAVDATAGKMTKKPVAVYIEKVYDEGNFGDLNIGT